MALLDKYRLRMAMYFILIAVVVLLFFKRTSPLHASAEQLAVQTTLNVINRAIVIKAYLKTSQYDTKIRLQGKNPVGLLIEPMSNYQGVIENVNQLNPGYWGFLDADKALVYSVKNKSFFKGSLGPYIKLWISQKRNRMYLKQNNYQWCQIKRHWGCGKW